MLDRRQLRNIGISAHIDAGKTTTTEQILFCTGAIHRFGNVDAGNTVTDYLPEEKQHGITITAAAVQTHWMRGALEYVLNLIDTPGHVDFTIEVERSMRVLDGTIVVLDASQGVEPQSETVWRQAQRYNVPRIVFVNKMDKVGADFQMVLADIAEKLGAKPLPVQWPVLVNDEFVGLVDLLELNATGFDGSALEVPAEALSARKALIESLAELDDEVLASYLSDQPLNTQTLRRALRDVTIQRKGFPVLCGSALKEKGIPELLDAVVDYLPSPLEVALPKQIPPAALSALAFKVITDKFGKLTFVRVYGGTLENGSYVYNANLKVRERIGRLVKLQGHQELEVEQLEAGEIGAIRGLKQTLTGHTLTREDDPPHLLESLYVPEPVVTLALEVANPAEQEKLLTALLRLTQEDPTLRLSTDPETGQLTLSGMGELHLEVQLERVQRENDLKIRTSAPQVSYRQTVASGAMISHLLKKQNGGVGQYAGLTLEVLPLDRGAGYVFENLIVGGAVPKQFIGSVEAGIQQALNGCSEYPLTDLQVRLLDGKHHAKDSSDIAFQVAAFEAFALALRQAGKLTLEPVMHLEATVPEAFTGAVLGDLNRRRGQVQGMEARGNAQVVKAQVPLAELFGYASDLRSLTQGRGSFSMQLDHYGEKPSK